LNTDFFTIENKDIVDAVNEDGRAISGGGQSARDMY
jgi:hypothetical protein